MCPSGDNQVILKWGYLYLSDVEYIISYNNSKSSSILSGAALTRTSTNSSCYWNINNKTSHNNTFYFKKQSDILDWQIFLSMIFTHRNHKLTKQHGGQLVLHFISKFSFTGNTYHYANHPSQYLGISVLGYQVSTLVPLPVQRY